MHALSCEEFPSLAAPFLAHRCSLGILPNKSVRNIHNGTFYFIIVTMNVVMSICLVGLFLAAIKVVFSVESMLASIASAI